MKTAENCSLCRPFDLRSQRTLPVERDIDVQTGEAVKDFAQDKTLRQRPQLPVGEAIRCQSEAGELNESSVTAWRMVQAIASRHY